MMIKLNMNENPYPPPENILKAAKRGFNNMNRYSKLKYSNRLRELIALYNNISKERIILSPGSEFLLREIINIFSKDRKIIMTNPTFFPALEHASKNAKKIIKYQLSPPEFKLNQEMILGEFYEPTLIIIDNPNNPTGKMLLDKSFVEKMLQNKNVFLLIDEAYYEFAKYTFIDLIEKYPNLAIARTMDKAFSLAGLRLGYFIAGEYFTRELSDFPKLLPTPTTFAAIEALKNHEYVNRNIKKIIGERKRVEDELKKLGIEVFPGEANFILIRCKMPNLAEKLVDKEIIIKDLSGNWLNNFYRISIGLPKENDAFLSEIGNIKTNYDPFVY
ncbi:MAG: aminotransferase class I/II-fold pyridoxal phosphate-dependent enzyme [Candidatus Thermoplasmatota archaeon]|nr:aminotransferase class I/II-fold pyridoxal phosphate-dependent enzyme [Candidatus Thermoplasmatota archaeon]